MSVPITLSAGKANDGRVAVSVGATSVLLTEESASWLHRELGRALDIETLSTQLQQELVVARRRVGGAASPPRLLGLRAAARARDRASGCSVKPGLTRAQWRLLRELYAMAPHPAMRTALTHVWGSTLQVLERRGLIVTWDADWPDACYARLIVLSRRGAGAVEAYFPEDRARVWNLLSFLPHAEASS